MARRPLVCLPLLAALACADDEPPEVAEAIGSTYVPRQPPAIDVLLVIDDSPSMRAFTTNGDFAFNLAAFGELIEDDEILGNVRFAITTTSVPGPTCAGPLARGGELLTDVCTSFAEQAFVGPDELDPAPVDAIAACTEACPLASLELRPSPVDEGQAELAVRPWIEADNNIDGGNLPSDVSLEQALTCVGMRGFGGCEYESPLAAASRALEHMRTPGDPAHGFLRDGVPLMIAFIGDEDDCSHPESSATIFDPEGEGVFWTDPDGPSSGICHRASTACDDEGCTIVDRDLDGEITDDFTSAALSSLVRFEAELETLRQDRVVEVELVGGVYSDGSLHWEPIAPVDAPRVEAFGWGPGCEEAQGRVAQPPGRLHEVISDHAAFTICLPDWTPIFSAALWHGHEDWFRPWFAPFGIADADPEFPGLQPDCELRIRTPRDELTPVSQCLRDDQGWLLDEDNYQYAIPDGADRCWVWLSDPGELTEDPYDDLWPEAVDRGYPAQFLIVARPDTFLPRDSVYESVCAPQ